MTGPWGLLVGIVMRESRSGRAGAGRRCHGGRGHGKVNGTGRERTYGKSRYQSSILGTGRGS